MATDLPIKSLLSELNNLQTEIKTRRTELKKYTDRVKEIKTKISIFLKEKNQPGVKDQSQGIAIIVEKKPAKRKKGEVKKDIMNVLRHYMDDNKAQKIYNEMNASDSKTETQDVLKIHKI